MSHTSKVNHTTTSKWTSTKTATTHPATDARPGLHIECIVDRSSSSSSSVASSATTPISSTTNHQPGTSAASRRRLDAVATCAPSLASCVGALVAVAASVSVRVDAVDDKVSYAHGLFILAMGFVFFVALTRFWQRLLLETEVGRAFCGRYRLLRSDALELTNKLVSAIQAVTSCVAGFMVCSSSCRRSFLTASHYMSDTYAWFGCAYFVYDMWSMYEVHVVKVADKRQLLDLQRQRGEPTAAKAVASEDGRGDGLYDRATGADAVVAAAQVSDADMALWMKRLKSVSVDERPTFLGYCAANPVMTIHHVFLQSFGLYVIVYLRGSFGDCVYGFVYLMEFSTPFVSVRAILSTLQLKDSRVYVANGLAMLATFFVCRVAMWPTLYWWYGQMVGLNAVQAMWSLPRTCKVGTAILFLPQLYWFYLMVCGAVKVLGPTSRKTTTPKTKVRAD